jgi:hypothetical protein
MATHDYVIANASGAAVRADLNNALAAIVSNNSNATEPATKYAYQWWADTNAGILKFRNAANDAWIDIIQLDGEYTTIGLENGSAAAPSLFFKDSGTDTGLLSPGADKVAISTGGVQRLTVDDSGRTLVGADSTLATSGHNSRIQVQGTDAATSSISLTRHSNDNGGAKLMIGKSRAASVGGATAIQVNDTTGQIDFVGADGTDMATRTATIRSQVDGAPGSNDMPGRLVFETTPDGSASPSERMQIDRRGQIQTQCDGTPSTDHLFSTVASANATYKILSLRRSASAGNLGTGTECCVVRRNGDLENTNNSYGSLSDVKLKENIVDANSQWEDLKQLQVRNYNFKVETGHQTHTQLGLIAQEVELVSPGLVKTTPDLDDKDVDLGTTTKSVNYSVLYMKAVKALQEAMTRIETLETKVSALEGGAS